MDNGHTDNRQRTRYHTDLLYADLTYVLNGIFFQINDQVGFGQTEKVYCDAIASLLEINKISSQRELYCPIQLNGKLIAKRYFDFLIEDKVVIEVKVGDYRYKETCSQLFGYLKSSKYKLGLIVRFTKGGVKIKRIPHLY